MIVMFILSLWGKQVFTEEDSATQLLYIFVLL